MQTIEGFALDDTPGVYHNSGQVAKQHMISPGQSHLNFQVACRGYLHSRALKTGWY